MITIGLAIVVSGFLGALLWASLAAVMFQPIFQRILARSPAHRNRAAAMALIVITVAVIIPALIVGSLVVGREMRKSVNDEIVASEWAARLDAGPFTEEDRRALDIWLAARPRRLGILLRARGAFGASCARNDAGS